METNKRLRKFRKELGFTQVEFANKLGIKQGSYSDIERGKTGMSSSIVRKLINTFRLNPTWLYEGIGESTLEAEAKKQGTPLRTLEDVKKALHEYRESEDDEQNLVQIIESQKETIKTQQEYINTLKNVIESLKAGKGGDIEEE